MPNDVRPIVKFHNGQNRFKVPFVMHADFESILNIIESSGSNPEESYIKEINQHIGIHQRRTFRNILQ